MARHWDDTAFRLPRNMCRKYCGAHIGRAGLRCVRRCGRNSNKSATTNATAFPTPALSAAQKLAKQVSKALTIGRANWSRPAICITTQECGLHQSGSSPCACHGPWARISSCGIWWMQTRQATPYHGAGWLACKRLARRSLRLRKTSPALRMADLHQRAWRPQQRCRRTWLHRSFGPCRKPHFSTHISLHIC